VGLQQMAGAGDGVLSAEVGEGHIVHFFIPTSPATFQTSTKTRVW
jgi:hypothetical protein